MMRKLTVCLTLVWVMLSASAWAESPEVNEDITKVYVMFKTHLLVNVGRATGLDYSISEPDISGGIHFNLSNNLWNTNFSMWNEGTLTYNFTIELTEI